MGRTTKDPVKHVITFRVNAEERDALQKMSDRMGVSVSSLMRTILKLLTEHLEQA